MNEKINSVVEGCFPDTPRSLMYCGIEEQIPENLSVLEIRDRRKYVLFCRSCFAEANIVNNPFFKDYEEIKKIKGGYPLENLIQNVSWIFDAQRSFTTRDGRIYVQDTYFHKDWRWYLDAVPIILEDCRKIFNGEISAGKLNENPHSAW